LCHIILDNAWPRTLKVIIYWKLIFKLIYFFHSSIQYIEALPLDQSFLTFHPFLCLDQMLDCCIMDHYILDDLNVNRKKSIILATYTEDIFKWAQQVFLCLYHNSVVLQKSMGYKLDPQLLHLELPQVFSISFKPLTCNFFFSMELFSFHFSETVQFQIWECQDESIMFVSKQCRACLDYSDV
jgi:hypothetical protein